VLGLAQLLPQGTNTQTNKACGAENKRRWFGHGGAGYGDVVKSPIARVLVQGGAFYADVVRASLSVHELNREVRIVSGSRIGDRGVQSGEPVLALTRG
jgi:hypothetical protein